MANPGILDELPILRFLPDETRAQVVRRFVPATFPFGGVLAEEGEAADALYVLVSGRARVVKRTDHDDEVPLNVLHAGDSFGEALAIGYTSAGEAWLAIGAPGEDIGPAQDAGNVTVVPRGTLQSEGVSYYQGKGSIPGSAETDDLFGLQLSVYDGTGLAVAAPRENVGSVEDAGQTAAQFFERRGRAVDGDDDGQVHDRLPRVGLTGLTFRPPDRPHPVRPCIP